MGSPTATRKLIRTPVKGILALSALIALFLVWLVYFKGSVTAPPWIGTLPAANAFFNAMSAICLSLGYWNIRHKRRVVHMRWMLSATVCSALFLVSYITYHYFHGDSHFLGQGWIRPVYFTILISHISLSIIALPFILTTLWLAAANRFDLHPRVARWTFPVWLYVSVTGILVFLIPKALS
jgi:putative membrane protein